MASALGLLGDIPFVCSSAATMTFKDLAVRRSARFSEHSVIGQKSVLEYVGQDLATVSFSIQLLSSLGIPPIVGLKTLKDVFEKHQPMRLLFGPDYLGKFVIESIEEERKHHTALGLCISAEVRLTLKEVS